MKMKNSPLIARVCSIEMLLITGIVAALCLASTFTFRPASSLNSPKEGVEPFSVRAGASATQRPQALNNSLYPRAGKSSQKQSRFNPQTHQAGLPPEALSLSNASLRRLSHANCCFLPRAALFYSKTRGRAPPLLT